jgi:hypothetical protein
MVRMRAEFVGLLEGTDAICRQSNHVYASSCLFTMFKKIEKPDACEMSSGIRFLNARNMKPADILRRVCEVYGEHAMSDSMVMNEVKMCMTIRGGADSLWLMKILCVQWKIRFEYNLRNYVSVQNLKEKYLKCYKTVMLYIKANI